ncbi:hypothetical protein AGRA3207_001563 [Actinomadura graeca]|uniref:Uncharacterized protein n=1 Tax=Actinomadura graeca TaxID=2750812 RepID=A0ABX8QQ88_9ACTN|nr:hypothetical protein [Actinomadura graeca]QXJ20790.1 hypothetical protein AGRA3207_001563 [Actinomadura graeca]
MNEDDLLAHVRAAFEMLDPVPRSVLSAGRAAIGWRLPSAALAGLTGDRDGPVAAGVRGGTARTLTFTCPGLTLEVEVTGAGRDREVSGRLVPPAPALVEVRHPDVPPGGLTARAGPGGLFCLPCVPEGPVSLVLRLADETSVVTSWIRL